MVSEFNINPEYLEVKSINTKQQAIEVKNLLVEPEIKQIYPLMIECMEVHGRWDIPILASLEVGKVWGFGLELSDEIITNNTCEQILQIINSNYNVNTAVPQPI